MLKTLEPTRGRKILNTPDPQPQSQLHGYVGGGRDRFPGGGNMELKVTFALPSFKGVQLTHTS